MTKPDDSISAGETSAVGVQPGISTQKPTKPPLLTFVDSLPERKTKLLAVVTPDMESGRTYQMSGAAYHYADSIVRILVELYGYYRWKPFNDQSPKDYFRDFIRYRIKWHDATGASVDSGFRGSSMISLIAFKVAEDVEELVEEMVWALVVEQNFDFDSWRRRWRDTE